MGGDHWKSLANKLGAPGVDAPTVETAPEAATRSAPPAPEKPVAVPTPASRRHDTAQSSDRPAVPEAAPSTPAVPAPIARMPEKAPKRKSSWDTLTSFFGISSAPEAPEAPAVELSSAAPAETDALEAPSSRRNAYESNPPRGYEPKGRPESTRAAEPRGQERVQERSPEVRSQEPKGSALESLFGEAPRQPLSWEKPAPRRMVDDVSGWEDEERAEIYEEPEGEEPGLAPLRGEEAEAESEAPQRRRRRRRRGSRRDREEGAPPQAARGEGRHAGSVRGEHVEPEEWADEEMLEPGESADRWAEPEALESSAEEIEGGVPERRSSRRRRRGRGRERAEEGAEEPRATREPSEARAPREPREPRPAREPRAAREVEGREREPREAREPREPRPAREPRVFEDEGPVTGERTRREPRQRPPRAAEAPRRELAAVPSEDLDDEVDSSLAAELEEGGPNRHPKIPTWADSLEGIIGANMDNHRRIESQRGGASRGRPRGGNGGGGAPRR